MSNKVTTPYPLFSDIDGSPLNAGFLFFGESEKDAEQFPITAYWDDAKTQIVEQPVPTRNGFIVRDNLPAKIFIEEESCSITIKNKSGTLIHKVETYDQFSTVKGVKALINAEQARAENAEQSLDLKITLEKDRAINVEQNLQLQITTSNAGIKYFSTEAELLAFVPTTTDPKQAYAFDTKKNYLWVLKSGSITDYEWKDEGSSQLDLANSYARSLLPITAIGNMYDRNLDKNGYFVNLSNGEIRTSANTALTVIEVKSGQTYAIRASSFSPNWFCAGVKTDSALSGISTKLTLTDTSEANVKLITIPAGPASQFLFLNTYLQAGTFDIRNSLVINEGNKITSTDPLRKIIKEANNAAIYDEDAQEKIAALQVSTVKVTDLETSSKNIYEDAVVHENFYVNPATNKVGTVTGTPYEPTALSVMQVVAGKTYFIYSPSYHQYSFSATLSDSDTVFATKENTAITLVDTEYANVKSFTFTDVNLKYLFINTEVSSQGFNIRNTLRVLADVYSDGYYLYKVKGASPYDAEAHDRLDKIDSRLTNKVWVGVGDSITEKNFRTLKNYHDFIRERVTNLSFSNYGKSGTGYFDRSNVADTITEVEPDIISVFWGTNDWEYANKPIGSFLDSTTSTMSGCINIALTGLINKFPKSTIVVFAPLPRLNNWGESGTNNSNNYDLLDLVLLIKRYAEHYSLPFLDLYHESNLPVWTTEGNRIYFTAPSRPDPDGLHPNDAGHLKISWRIQKFLEALV